MYDDVYIQKLKKGAIVVPPKVRITKEMLAARRGEQDTETV